MADLLTDSAPPRVTERVTAASLTWLLCGYRFPFGTELELQNAVAEVLTRHGLAFEREKTLGDHGTIDFYFPAVRLGLELKTKGSPGDVTRQLYRYAQARDIAELMLLTARCRLGRLPESMNGKRVTVVTVWENQL